MKKTLCMLVSALALSSPAAHATSLHENFAPSAVPDSWSNPVGASSTADSEDSDLVMPSAFKPSGPDGSCRLVVWDVGWDQNSNWLGVQGGRENCTNPATFTVRLRKDIPWRPDPILGSTTGTNNGIIRAFAACNGAGEYYGDVASSTGLEHRGDNTGACN